MSIAQIADVIKNNNSFAIVIHINPDGDCVGSAAALVGTLRNMGKKAYAFVDGAIPERLSFIWNEDYTGIDEDEYEVCIAVDVAAEYMMGKMKENIFDKSKITCCLDHHGTNSGYADLNFVNADASAAGEVVFELITNGLKQELSTDTAKCIYTAIASDTGSFRYSNTTSKTHLIVSELLKYNINAPSIMRMLFEQKTIEQLRMKNEIVSNFRFYKNNKICVASVDKNLLDKYGMTFEQTDDIASLPRTVIGVEVGVYLKIKNENEVKVSLRSNECVDVSKVASAFGGGGHIRAAGATINASAKEAEEKVINELLKVM